MNILFHLQRAIYLLIFLFRTKCLTNIYSFIFLRKLLLFFNLNFSEK